MKMESIAECSEGSILQYNWPALSDNWSWKPIFSLFESGRFTQVLLYMVRKINVLIRIISLTSERKHFLGAVTQKNHLQ